MDPRWPDHLFKDDANARSDVEPDCTADAPLSPTPSADTASPDCYPDAASGAFRSPAFEGLGIGEAQTCHSLGDVDLHLQQFAHMDDIWGQPSSDPEPAEGASSEGLSEEWINSTLRLIDMSREQLHTVCLQSAQAATSSRYVGGDTAAAGGSVPRHAQPLYSQKELVFLEAALRPSEGDGSEQAASRPARESRRGLASRPGARNSAISTEPQSVAARQRRGRIREKLSQLQELVPGGAAMDTAALLDEAALYVTFLQAEVQALDNGTSRLLRSRDR